MNISKKIINSVLNLVILLLVVSAKSIFAQECSRFYLKSLSPNFFDKHYDKEFRTFSLRAKKVWFNDFSLHWQYIEADASLGNKKISILGELGIKNELGKIKTPTHLEFTRNYIRFAKKIGIPQDKLLMPAAVLIKGSRYQLVIPGVDPWPSEPGYRVLSANEQFNIPFRVVLEGLKVNKFPLLEAAHDVFHFVSFLMNPEYVHLLNEKVRKLQEVEKYPVSFSRRLFYILEYLTIGNKDRKEEMQKIFLSPVIKKGHSQLAFSPHFEFFRELNIEKILSHGETLIRNYDELLVNIGGASAYSWEKMLLSNTLYGSTYGQEALQATLLHFVEKNRPSELVSITEDQVGGLSSRLLEFLLNIRKMPPEKILELCNSNVQVRKFFKISGNTLPRDYLDRIDHMIRTQVARMEYFAWETANEMDLNLWIQDGLSIVVPKNSPLGDFSKEAFGENSTLYRIILNKK